MPAAGVFGWGESYRDWVDYSRLGALVTNPVSLRPRKPAHGPRLATRENAWIVHTGLPNPGLKAILKRYTPIWSRLGLPVLLHLIATTATEIVEAAEMIAAVPEIAGIELGLDEDTGSSEALSLLRAARSAGSPVIVRLPFNGVAHLAPRLADAGADALTLTSPLRAAVWQPHDQTTPQLIRGRIYDPALFPLLVQTLSQYTNRLEIPILACGGIASPADAQTCLELGAAAVQIDGLLWRDPDLINRIAAALKDKN
jgi:dihydroorotate dehydrogenase (NAD+) catalytic subunit